MRTSLPNQFVAYHTKAVTPTALAAAAASGKSVEFDVSVDDTGRLYLGHPASYYVYKGYPNPNQLSLTEAYALARDAGIAVVFDVKDVRAIDGIRRYVEEIGPGRALVHAWAAELCFNADDTRPPEPQWVVENLPLAALADLRDKTGVGVMVSCRGLDGARLEAHGAQLFPHLFAAAAAADSIDLNFPAGEVPPRWVLDRLLEHSLLPGLNFDRLLAASHRPSSYWALSDKLEHATVIA